MKTIITLLLILFLAGCSSWHPDNRVRIQPERSISDERYDEMRLYVLRYLYDQHVLSEEAEN